MILQLEGFCQELKSSAHIINIYTGHSRGLTFSSALFGGAAAAIR